MTVIECMETDKKLRNMMVQAVVDRSIMGWMIDDVEIDGATYFKRAMPVKRTDSIEDLIKKYVDFFPDEAKIFVEHMKVVKQSVRDEKGMSLNKTVRFAASLPDILFELIKTYYPQYLEKDGLHMLKKLAPVLCI